MFRASFDTPWAPPDDMDSSSDEDGEYLHPRHHHYRHRHHPSDSESDAEEQVSFAPAASRSAREAQEPCRCPLGPVFHSSFSYFSDSCSWAASPSERTSSSSSSPLRQAPRVQRAPVRPPPPAQHPVQQFLRFSRRSQRTTLSAKRTMPTRSPGTTRSRPRRSSGASTACLSTPRGACLLEDVSEARSESIMRRAESSRRKMVRTWTRCRPRRPTCPRRCGLGTSTRF